MFEFLEEMEYEESPINEPRKLKIIDQGYYKEYEYFILSLQTHPCAYIILTENDKFYHKNYDEIEGIECHGGLTYSCDYLGNDDDLFVPESEQVWVIGWDYAHDGDRVGSVDGKCWTKKEILDEVKCVVEQLVRVQ